MKVSRIIIIVVVLFVIAIVALAAYSALTTKSILPWKSAAGYPLQIDGTIGVSGQPCVNSMAYVYCIGGQDAYLGPHNGVYTSSAVSSTSSNITSWTLDSSPYPQTVYAQACVAYSGFVYCVGGTFDDAGDDANSSYFAPLNSNVVGPWNSTTGYPVYVDSQSCVASSGYIYCVGGASEAHGNNASRAWSNNVYYAPLYSSGIGTWRPSTAYPANTYLPSCLAVNGYIYCFGGIDTNGNALSSVYYALLSSTGVGAWTQTTAYPLQGVFQACAASSGYVYCVGGEGSNGYTNAVYYATMSSGGIGTWTKAANYPDSVSTSCAISSGTLYCVGGLDGSSAGETGAAYYVSLDSLLGVTTTS